MNKKVISVVLLVVIVFASYIIFKNKDAAFVLSENIKKIFENRKQKKGGTTMIVNALRMSATKEYLVDKSDIIMIARVNNVETKEVPRIATLPVKFIEKEAQKKGIKLDKTSPDYIREMTESIIVRDYHVSVEKYLKDRYNFNGPEIIVRELGGTFRGKTMIVEDSVEYQIGDNVLFFLVRLEDNIFGLVSGGPEAKYTISTTGDVGIGKNEHALLKRTFGMEQFKLNDFIDEIKRIEKTIK